MGDNEFEFLPSEIANLKNLQIVSLKTIADRSLSRSFMPFYPVENPTDKINVAAPNSITILNSFPRFLRAAQVQGKERRELERNN